MRVEQHPLGVSVLVMERARNNKGDYENRFDLEAVRMINQLLDQVIADRSRALVITGGESGKFFSNGHDIAALERGMDDGSAHVFISEFYKLLARFMCFPIPTVAAINGHAFAGGCLLAMAQDYRIMRDDRGFICMNEIDMLQENAPPSASKILPGVFKDADRKMTNVLRAKVAPLVLRDMYLRGLRLDGKAAVQLGLVDATSKSVVADAVELAGKLGAKAHPANRRTVAVLKFEMVRDYIRVLTDVGEEELLRTTLSRL